MDKYHQPLSSRRWGKSGCRVIFMATPSALGCDSGSSNNAGSIEKDMQRAARVVWTRMQANTQLDVKLHMLWVTKDSIKGQWPDTASQPLTPGQLKAQMCRLVQCHLDLQSVRITGIPMKDAEKVGTISPKSS